MEDACDYKSFEELNTARKSISTPKGKKYNSLYLAGYNKENIPVFAFTPDEFYKENNCSTNLSVLNFFNYMYDYFSKPYIFFVLFSPSFTVFPSLINTYKIIPKPYRKNIKYLCLWKPTIYANTVVYVFKPFISSKFYKKIIYLQSYQEVVNFFNTTSLNLPQAVVQNNVVVPQSESFIHTVTVLQESSRTPTGIPFVITECCTYLKAHGQQVQGLFRIPGNTQVYEEMLSSLMKGQPLNQAYTDLSTIHNVSSAFKKYLRILQDGLLPDYLYEDIIKSVQTKTISDYIVIHHIGTVLSQLPAASYRSLQYVILFLSEMTQYASVTLMDSSNLAIVFAPSLIRTPASLPSERALLEIGLCIKFVNLLILQHEAIFKETDTLRSAQKPAITSARTAQRSARVNLTDLNKMLKENNVLMNTTPTLPGRSPLRCAPLALEDINEEEEHRHSLRKSHSSTSLQEGSSKLSLQEPVQEPVQEPAQEPVQEPQEPAPKPKSKFSFKKLFGIKH